MTARASRRSTKPSVVRAPEPPRRHRFRPTWGRDGRHIAHANSYGVHTFMDDVAAGGYRIPVYQRGWSWSDAHIVELLDALLIGSYVGTLLVWECYGLLPSFERIGEVSVASAGPRAHVVIDGQHRIGALMTAAHAGRFFLDLQIGQFVVGEPGPWLCPASHALNSDVYYDDHDRSWARAHAADHGLDPHEVVGAWSTAYGMMGRAEMHVCAMGYQWSMTEIINTYRRLNTTGVKMSAEDLDVGLRRAGVAP